MILTLKKTLKAKMKTSYQTVFTGVVFLCAHFPKQINNTNSTAYLKQWDLLYVYQGTHLTTNTGTSFSYVN